MSLRFSYIGSMLSEFDFYNIVYDFMYEPELYNCESYMIRESTHEIHLLNSINELTSIRLRYFGSLHEFDSNLQKSKSFYQELLLLLCTYEANFSIMVLQVHDKNINL